MKIRRKLLRPPTGGRMEYIMKIKLFSGKRSRTGVFAAITAAVMALLFAATLLITNLSIYRTVFIDMTPEGLYTLSDGMREQCSFIDKLGEGEENPPELKVTFCADPDVLLGSTVTRAIYQMVIQLHNEYPKLKFEEVNVTLNPNAVSKYKTTSLSTITPGDIIVSYGDTYRVVSAESFWPKNKDGAYASFNGEYRLATLLMSVTAKDRPMAYFVTGHGETVYNAEEPESEDSLSLGHFVDLLRDIGLSAGVLNLSEVDEIPDDCRLLIINNPTSDFLTDETKHDEFGYIGELEMIDRYLVNECGALFVAKDYKTRLENLEVFMKEWGIGFSETLVRDDKASLQDKDNTHTSLLAKYDTDKEGYAYQIYGEYADLSSAPRMVIPNTGYVYCSFGASDKVSESGGFNTSRTYASFLTSYETAVPYGKSDVSGEYRLLAGEPSALDLVAVSVRVSQDDHSGEDYYSYVMAAASPDFLSGEVIGSASFANFDIVSALLKSTAKTDVYASTDIGGMSYNSASYGGKPLLDTSLSTSPVDVYSPSGKDIIERNYAINDGVRIGFAVFAAAVPVLVMALGAFVCLKRRFK